jgi:hypothetical protein
VAYTRERRIGWDEGERVRDTCGTHERRIDTRKGRTQRANIGVDYMGQPRKKSCAGTENPAGAEQAEKREIESM